MSFPDVASTRAQARETWEREQRKRIPLQERIGLSVPWWLVIVAGVFFALSIPHTAQTFAIITPAVGYVAPLGVEFGLLYTSFRKRQLRSIAKESVPRSVLLLEVLLFVVAIGVNGVGTLQAVASDAGLRDQSIREVISSFGDMSATRQVALMMVPMAALIIPIGTMVAGEGLAALFLENRERRQTFDEQWRMVRVEVEFEALRDAALAKGIEPKEAIRWAAQITGHTVSVRPRRTRADTRTVVRPANNGHGIGQDHSRTADARDRVRIYLEEHPEAIELSVRALAELSGVGKTIAAEELSAYKQALLNNDGHGQD
jgi:hypothetical protein